MALDEVEAGNPVPVVLGPRVVALCRVADTVYAIDDTCSHMEASLSEGTLQGTVITCPRHGGQFDIRTGEAVRMPAVDPIDTFPVRIEDGRIWVNTEKV
jgi:3-phenylpropionate/trans-cinnamate dioxygenase ferredoxin subunit